MKKHDKNTPYFHWLLQESSNSEYKTHCYTEFPDFGTIERCIKSKPSDYSISSSKFDGVMDFWINLVEHAENGNMIFIVDRFFDEHCFYYLFKYIEASTILKDNNSGKIIILTKDDESKKINKILNQYKIGEEKIKTYVQGGTHYKNFDCHDRFALVGDCFWHFGSTVGGIYNGFQLTAYSGPWKDTNKSLYESLSTPIKPRHSSNI